MFLPITIDGADGSRFDIFGNLLGPDNQVVAFDRMIIIPSSSSDKNYADIETIITHNLRVNSFEDKDVFYSPYSNHELDEYSTRFVRDYMSAYTYKFSFGSLILRLLPGGTYGDLLENYIISKDYSDDCLQINWLDSNDRPFSSEDLSSRPDGPRVWIFDSSEHHSFETKALRWLAFSSTRRNDFYDYINRRLRLQKEINTWQPEDYMIELRHGKPLWIGMTRHLIEFCKTRSIYIIKPILRAYFSHSNYKENEAKLLEVWPNLHELL